MTWYATLENHTTKLARVTAIAGGLGLLFATGVTCVSILLKLIRRGLDATLGSVMDGTSWAFVRPILGEEELVSYGVALALFAALPWVTLQRGHIRVDLFERAFGPRLNRVLDLAADVMIAVIAYLLFTRQWFLIFKKARRSQDSLGSEVLTGNWGIIADRLRDTQESQILGIPLWPTYVIAQGFLGIFLVVAGFCVLRSLKALWVADT